MSSFGERRQRLRETLTSLHHAVQELKNRSAGPVIMPQGPVATALKYGLGGLALLLTATVSHFAIDSYMYGGAYKQTLETLARNSAEACGTDDAEKSAIFDDVYSDVRLSTKMGWTSHLPLIGNWLPRMEFMPNRRLYKTVEAAEQNHMTLLPMGSRLTNFFNMNNGIQAVLFYDGPGHPAVMGYTSLSDNQLGLMVDAVEEAGGPQPGALVLRWNKVADDYETVFVPPGQASFGISGGFANVALPANPCKTVASQDEGAVSTERESAPDAGAEEGFWRRHTGWLRNHMPFGGGDNNTPAPGPN